MSSFTQGGTCCVLLTLVGFFILFGQGNSMSISIKSEYFMDDSLITKHCGKLKQSSNGYVRSHTGAQLNQKFDSFGDAASTITDAVATKYPHNNDCWIVIDVTLGWRVLVQFPGAVDLSTHGSACGDRLMVYDGNIRTHPSATPLLSLCGQHDKVPAVETTGQYVTLHFQTDGLGSGEGFNIFFSSFRRAETCTAGQFKCDANRCIPTSYECDTVHQCLDGADEDPAKGASCSLIKTAVGALLSLGLYTIIGISAGGLLLLLALILCCYCCCCRNKGQYS